MSLLTDAAEWFKARQTVVQSWYEDDQGRYAFRVTVNDQAFIVTAKKYLNDGEASFFEGKVVQRAIDQNAFILLALGTGDRLLFDPEYVKQNGASDDVSTQDRQRRNESWVSVDADASVSFREWYDHGATPDEPAEKPTDITGWGDTDG